MNMKTNYLKLNSWAVAAPVSYTHLTWSPDGHASAPTAVSMLHAGVLMKLGGYGCFRIAMYLMPEAANELGWIFLILTGISVVYGAFSACVQTDLKYINCLLYTSRCV